MKLKVMVWEEKGSLAFSKFEERRKGLKRKIFFQKSRPP
jgi:hypothetical protein